MAKKFGSCQYTKLQRKWELSTEKSQFSYNILQKHTDWNFRITYRTVHFLKLWFPTLQFVLVLSMPNLNSMCFIVSNLYWQAKCLWISMNFFSSEPWYSFSKFEMDRSLASPKRHIATWTNHYHTVWKGCLPDWIVDPVCSIFIHSFIILALIDSRCSNKSKKWFEFIFY